MSLVDMNKKTILTIDVFDPEETLVSLFETNGVEYSYQDKNPAIKIAKNRCLDVIGDPGDASNIPLLAAVFVEWLNASAVRKIQAQMNDCSIVYLEGLSLEDVTGILKNTLRVIAFDLEYNNVIGRVN